MVDAGRKVEKLEIPDVGVEEKIILSRDRAGGGGVRLGVELEDIGRDRRDSIRRNGVAWERGTDPVIALEAASKWIEDGVEGAIVVEGLREIAAALLGGWYRRNRFRRIECVFPVFFVGEEEKCLILAAV